MVKRVAGGRRLPVLPIWMAKLAAPVIGWWARRKKERPYIQKLLVHFGQQQQFFAR